jgi:hypothetical protein
MNNVDVFALNLLQFYLLQKKGSNQQTKKNLNQRWLTTGVSFFPKKSNQIQVEYIYLFIVEVQVRNYRCSVIAHGSYPRFPTLECPARLG